MTAAGLSHRERTLAVLAGTIVLGVLVVSLVIDPQLKIRRQRRHHLQEMQLDLTKMKAALLIKNRINAAYGEVESLLSGPGTDQQETSVFTRELNDLYATSNVKTKSVTILPAQHEEAYRLLSIKLEITGPVRDVVRFVLSIENHPKPLRIEQLTLRALEVPDMVQGSFVISKIIGASAERSLSRVAETAR